MNAYRKLGLFIKEDTLWDIFNQCLFGLQYIHNQGVIHRDIKLGNLFMDENGNIQIGDFGISAAMTKLVKMMHINLLKMKKLMTFYLIRLRQLVLKVLWLPKYQWVNYMTKKLMFFQWEFAFIFYAFKIFLMVTFICLIYIEIKYIQQN